MRLGVTNPTALLGKAPTVNDWQCHIISFSESSHTKKAVRALGSEFRRFGYSLSLSKPVPDKFQVGSPSGSFRGLSRGVALASKFPVYSPCPSFIPLIAWDSQRILYSVVQIGQIPIHLVTVYLYPCALPGSHKYRLNCQILAWAHQILSQIDGLVCLCGDFNAPLDSFDSMRQLLAEGWEDLALLCNRLYQDPLGPTCKGSTRHTFGVGNSELCRFAKRAWVDHEFDMDAHAVQLFSFDLPSYNIMLWKWLLPNSMDHCTVDHVSLVHQAGQEADQLQHQVSQCVAVQDMNGALSLWSRNCENLLAQHSLTQEGCPPVSKRFLGRAQQVSPVKRALTAPRFKQGRMNDFCVGTLANSLEVRQVQKQARRMQALVRTRSCPFFGPIQNAKCAELWAAIRRSSGFRPDFPRWMFSELGIDVYLPIEGDDLSRISDHVFAYANQLARARWKAKKTEFTAEVEESWKAKGGRLPFGLLREKPLPPVTDLKICLDVKLAPQRWSPVGKAWIQVNNCNDFEKDDILYNGQLQVRVMDKKDNYLQVNRLLSRREAAGLTKTFTTANPEIWCPHFLDKWAEYWKRDDGDTDVPSDEFLHLLPQQVPQSLGPLCWEQWSRALKSAKSSSMRGTDSWSVTELKRLPQSVVEVLLSIFNAVEDGNQWPEQLTHWKLIVLRKSGTVDVDWTILRPISVAGMLYRIWARMRTAQFLAHCATFKRPMVSPTLSTRAVWCFIADKIDFEFAQNRKICGVVLDIIKCYNAIHRRTLFNAMKRLGFCPRVLRARATALTQMARSALVSGFSYGQASSCTGIPEGDPLSNAGMFCLSFWYSCFARQQAENSLAITYADNWECLFGHVSQLISFLPELERFLEALRLPVNPGKCWSWSMDPDQRKALRAVRWCGDKLPVKLQAKELGADLAYCLKKAARVRNSRIQVAHQRLLRLSGVPGSRPQKQRLLLGGIWPQGLHAAETATVPRSVFKRLRTQTSVALNMARKGSNPFLVCLLACPKIVDPQFVLLCNRILLLRQVLRELPTFKPMFTELLVADHGRYKGPTRIMVRTLGLLGWNLRGGAVFADHMGRVFHLFLSPFKQICSLLGSSWADFVCVQIDHRKSLENVEGIDLQLTKAMPGLLPSEKGLVLCQQTGAFFTEDARKHCGGSGQCPKCDQPDSKQHRLENCEFVRHVREAFPSLMTRWPTLPDSTKYFSLIPELEDYRQWQKCLMDIPFPEVVRSPVLDQQIVYTDGSCLFPRWEHLRVASYAAICARSDGSFDIVSQGLLPTGFHNAYRAEIFGLAVAVRTYTRVIVSLDCKGVVHTAQALVDQLKRCGQAIYGRTLLKVSVVVTSTIAGSVGLKGTKIGKLDLLVTGQTLGLTIGPTGWQECPDIGCLVPTQCIGS